MIGNLSVGLKQHAVQLFEVRRLECDHLETLIHELRNIDEGEDGGEGKGVFGHHDIINVELFEISDKAKLKFISIKVEVFFWRWNFSVLRLELTWPGLNRSMTLPLKLSPSLQAGFGFFEFLKIYSQKPEKARKYSKAIALAPLSCDVPKSLVENCRLFGTPSGKLATPWYRVVLTRCNPQLWIEILIFRFLTKTIDPSLANFDTAKTVKIGKD